MKDSFNVLKEISILLKQEKAPLLQITDIIRIIDESINKITEDELLKLIYVSYSPAKLFQAMSNIPDPYGILGMSEDPELYKHRQGSALLHKALDRSLASLSFAPVSNGQAPMMLANQAMMDPLNSYKTAAESVKSITELDFDSMKVPALRMENYNAEITKAFNGRNLGILASYRDAVAAAIIDVSATNPDSIKNPQILVKEAKDEFYQNIRLSVISEVLKELEKLILDVRENLASLPNSGNAFNIQNIVTSESVSYSYDLSLHRGKSAREDAQYQDLLVAYERMNNLSKYLGQITIAFDKKLLDDLSGQEQRLALIFGANPQIRPTLMSFGSPEIYPTLLDEVALKGDAFTASRLIRAGAKTDTLVNPMPGWFNWMHNVNYFFKGCINWFMSIPTPKLKGETALLYAAKKLLENKGNDNNLQKPFLDTVLTIIDLGGDPYIYNRKAVSPYDILVTYTELTSPKRGELIKALRVKQVEMGEVIKIYAVTGITYADPFLNSIQNKFRTDLVLKLLNLKDYLGSGINANNLLTTLVEDKAVRDAVIDWIPAEIAKIFLPENQPKLIAAESNFKKESHYKAKSQELSGVFSNMVTMCKATDLGVDGLRMLYIPDQENVHSFLNDVVFLTSSPLTLVSVGLVNSAIPLVQQDYMKAIVNTVTTFGILSLQVAPVLLDLYFNFNFFTPMVKDAMSQYIMARSIDNLNEFIDSYNTPSSQLKSNMAYGRAAEFIGFEQTAEYYYSEAQKAREAIIGDCFSNCEDC